MSIKKGSLGFANVMNGIKQVAKIMKGVEIIWENKKPYMFLNDNTSIYKYSLPDFILIAQVNHAGSIYQLDYNGSYVYGRSASSDGQASVVDPVTMVLTPPQTTTYQNTGEVVSTYPPTTPHSDILKVAGRYIYSLTLPSYAETRYDTGNTLNVSRTNAFRNNLAMVFVGSISSTNVTLQLRSLEYPYDIISTKVLWSGGSSYYQTPALSGSHIYVHFTNNESSTPNETYLYIQDSANWGTAPVVKTVNHNLGDTQVHPRVAAGDTIYYCVCGTNTRYYVEVRSKSTNLVLDSLTFSAPGLNAWGATVGMLGDVMYLREGATIHEFNYNGSLIRTTHTTLNRNVYGQNKLVIAKL